MHRDTAIPCSAARALQVVIFSTGLFFSSGLFAEIPGTCEDGDRTPWSFSIPESETRIRWAWPIDSEADDPYSVPLSPEPENSPKLFERIAWLSPPISVSDWLTRDDYVIRAKSAPAEITLVRGGAPQLFGARGRLRGEYGDEFDDVKRIRGQMLLNLIGNHIGVDASVNSWEDNRPGPRSLGEFWTGDANLVYSMGAQRVAMRGGVGTSWVHDGETEFGLNTTYGADLFLTRPWLVSGELDYGKINGEKLRHWRATVGLQLLRLEVYLGYDSYKWNHIRFDGPVAGAGVWF